MVNRNVVAAKLTELDRRLGRVIRHRAVSSDALLADADALDIVSFNLMLAVQACSDIASHIIADAGWPSARTLGEGFVRLSQQGVLTAKTAAALARAIGLRNVVAHGYAGVDVAAIHAAATQGVVELETFAAEVAGWLGTQP